MSMYAYLPTGMAALTPSPIGKEMTYIHVGVLLMITWNLALVHIMTGR